MNHGNFMTFVSASSSDGWAHFQAVGTILVALAIGIATAVIALKQKDIAKAQKDIAQAKLKLDLFERRYKIFTQLMQITLDTCRFTPKHPMFSHIEYGTPFEPFESESSFLFGPDMALYIHELSHKWTSYRGVINEPPKEWERHQDELSGLQVYFAMQAQTGLHEHFSPFLDFANWK